ncbi:unnamed protein product [Caenorhabditis bovis]|uniref:Arb2 domain-containing protein n=1 Tax=Caenorhabditis bovis TaxID=2654633 RepID=A0A8S1ES60_9PELO|nr:unnamed protein product [Caenorhabditis bovis]
MPCERRYEDVSIRDVKFELNTSSLSSNCEQTKQKQNEDKQAVKTEISAVLNTLQDIESTIKKFRETIDQTKNDKIVKILNSTKLEIIDICNSKTARESQKYGMTTSNIGFGLAEKHRKKESLKDLGYSFDSDGKLRRTSNGADFKYTSQIEYERLGRAITEHIYEKMENELGLKKMPVIDQQVGSNCPDDTGFVFVSRNYEITETLLVLINGSGAVRAGQWARSVIINDSLDKGSQLFYINRAIKNNWGVVVFNANHNCDEQGRPLKYSRTPSEHAINAWKYIVQPAKCQEIYAVAHSSGGSILNSAILRTNDQRVRKVCLVDAYGFTPSDKNQLVVNFTTRSVSNYGNRKIYSGTDSHFYTTYCSRNAVFHIFETQTTLNNYSNVIEDASKMVIQFKAPSFSKAWQHY